MGCLFGKSSKRTYSFSQQVNMFISLTFLAITGLIQQNHYRSLYHEKEGECVCVCHAHSNENTQILTANHLLTFNKEKA